MYKTRLEQLGVEIDVRVHYIETKAKTAFCDTKSMATTHGRNMMLLFDDDNLVVLSRRPVTTIATVSMMQWIWYEQQNVGAICSIIV